MSGYITEGKKRVTPGRLSEMKQKGEKIAMLTAYDFTTASIVNQTNVEMILVGDSASNVMAGNSTTLPITVDQMISHATSVVRAIDTALVVVDMPFGSYHGAPHLGVSNAVRMIKESGAAAVKLEGGEEIAQTIREIVAAGIPVMGHLGLMPQSIHRYGGYGLRAKDEAEAEKLIQDALLLEKCGCFSLVLEKIPATLAERVSKQLHIPVIGIGAGAGVDGQVLVIQDMLGMNQSFKPKFLRHYANLHQIMTDAINHYVQDVKDRSFPSLEEQY